MRGAAAQTGETRGTARSGSRLLLAPLFVEGVKRRKELSHHLLAHQLKPRHPIRASRLQRAGCGSEHRPFHFDRTQEPRARAFRSWLHTIIHRRIACQIREHLAAPCVSEWHACVFPFFPWGCHQDCDVGTNKTQNCGYSKVRLLPRLGAARPVPSRKEFACVPAAVRSTESMSSCSR